MACRCRSRSEGAAETVEGEMARELPWRDRNSGSSFHNGLRSKSSNRLTSKDEASRELPPTTRPHWTLPSLRDWHQTESPRRMHLNQETLSARNGASSKAAGDKRPGRKVWHRQMTVARRSVLPCLVDPAPFLARALAFRLQTLLAVPRQSLPGWRVARLHR